MIVTARKKGSIIEGEGEYLQLYFRGKFTGPNVFSSKFWVDFLILDLVLVELMMDTGLPLV